MTERNRTASTLGWVDDIERVTTDNTDFRRVLFTGMHLQLTVMSLAPGEDIGWEMHDHLDQFLRIERGSGTLKLGRSADEIAEEHTVSDDWAMIIPAGTWHDVVNDGDGELKLYSIYGPPDHPPGTVHVTKADAEAAHAAEAAEAAEAAGPAGAHDEHDHHAPSPDD